MKGNIMELIFNAVAFVLVLGVPVFMVYTLVTQRKVKEPMNVLRPGNLLDATDGEGVPVDLELPALDLQIVRAEYEAMTKDELLDRLAAHGVTDGLSRKTKAQLIELLMGLATPE